MSQVVISDFLVRLIRKHWQSIVAFTAGGFVVAFVIVFFIITPTYESSAQVLVNRPNKNAATEYAGQTVDSQMLTTYKDLISDRVILKPAQRHLRERDNVKRSLKSLKEDVTVTTNANSQVFSITAADHNAKTSAKIANEVARTFKRLIPGIIKVNNVTIVSPAHPERKPVYPRRAKSVVLGTILGFIIGIVYAVARMLTDRKVHNVRFLTNSMDLNNLGTVSHQPVRSLGVQKQALHSFHQKQAAPTRQSRHEN